MKGRRLPDQSTDTAWRMEPGDYVRATYPAGVERGPEWWCCTPNGLHGNLRNHHVVEHEDGTITVSPSILVGRSAAMAELWHGYLERGVWRSC